MIKVLHTIPAMDGGGADRILYDYTIRMLDDFQVDFIVHSEFEGILEKDLISRGCRVFHVSALRKNKKEYKKRIQEIIRNGNYDIIHVSQGYRGVYFLHYAKKYGVKIRIAHSHMAYIPESFKEVIIRKMATLYVKRCATALFACGDDAAKWMWGKKAFNKRKVYIMKNAIQAERFSFSPEKRECIRQEYNVTDKFVIGNVARFSYQKNHEFLIKIFAELKKVNSNAVLMLIGRGELKNDIKKQVEELGLTDSVLFMGVRNDVPDLLNAMDVFALPSRFEGLPVTLVEIQANGLPAVISSCVTKEMTISDDFCFLSLSQPISEWADIIVKNKRKDSANLIKNTAYDLRVASDGLKNKYLSMI